MKEQEVPLHIIFLSIYKFFVTRFLIIAVFTVSGAALGAFYHFNKTNTYTSKAIAYSPVVSNQRLAEILNNLEELRKTGQPDLLASALDLKTEETGNIKEIDCQIMRDNDYLFDKDQNPRYESNCVTITVRSNDAQIFEILNDKLAQFTAQNQFIQQKVNMRKKGMQNIIDKYEEEISEIDSLQKLKIQRMASAQNVTDFFEMNISSAETQSLTLKRQLENAKEDFAFIQPLVFVERLKPVPFTEAIIYKPVLVLGFVFFIFGIFVSLILHFNQLLRNAKKEAE